jgi:hypothetical protein
MKIRSLFLALCAYLSLSMAHAAAPRKYAVLSLVGDSITVLTYTQAVGSHIAPLNRQQLDLNSIALDDYSSKAIAHFINKQEPEASVQSLLTTDAPLRKAQNAMFEEADKNAELRARMASVWQGSDATHIIVVTRHRSDLEVNFANTTQLVGKADGIGFYLDDRIEMTSNSRPDTVTGMIMPFAYLKLRLVDAKTLDVVREVKVRESRVLGAKEDGEATLYAWNVLTPKQKLDSLHTLLGRAMSKAIPSLLAD